MTFLYDTLVQKFGKRYLLQVEVPNYITDNLKYKIRPYQKEAFQRYILFNENDFDAKLNKPHHLLFNMATGSGKTLVMAGLILYLYKKGYRNFLFFVNSNNIINKTKDNFLNPYTSKYLFTEKIVIDGNEVQIKEVQNFEEADNENINIKFTTIQQLHLDLNNTKENSITYEDFKDKKIVLIADEAHHFSSATRKKEDLLGSWEGTVIKILKQNLDNILLEFTATLNYDNREIIEKYKDKVIFRYDLAQFRIDGYSKEINLIRSLYDERERIIQALILNLYRQELAIKYGINLKPVILFKAKRTIKESEQNKANFHKLIYELDKTDIEKIKISSTVPIVQKAFTFFENNNISSIDIANRIKSNFREENCISANNDKEAERNQILLNTLEDENNPIRAVFAVQKLNEGWDVLNLFDIVRLYDSSNGRTGNLRKTTISEAQLIGRGARYFPFVLEGEQDPYTRKYDDDLSNDLRILEELYYHTREDSRYISELKKALIDTGIYEDDEKLEIKQLELKEEFKKTDFYKKGRVIFNKKIKKSFNNIKSFNDLGVKKRNFTFTLSSGIGRVSSAFLEIERTKQKNEIISSKDIKLLEIPKHIIRYALSQNPFFHFNNLQRYFYNIHSLSEFIENKDYLGGFKITFKGTKDRLKKISNSDYLMVLQKLLQTIEDDIRSNLTEYENSDWMYDYICNIFKDKEIKIYKDSKQVYMQETIIKESWYIYNHYYWTDKEKKFIKIFTKNFGMLKQNFENIYLIKNEKTLKIYDKKGRSFTPDFILFCKPKNRKEITYQIFIELKREYLQVYDKWKEDFLQEIKDRKEIFTIDNNKYLLTGMLFYINDNEKKFQEFFKNLW